jgi:signal transduction histidine kinase
MVRGFDCIQDDDCVRFLCNVLFPKDQSVFYRVDVMFLHSPLSGWAVATPMRRTVGDSDLHQQLINLLQHSLMDGVCVVRFLDETSDSETVFVTSDRLTVCPVPPLARVEQALRLVGLPSLLQHLDRQILPTYHLYASCLGNDAGRLSYLVAWHSSELQPWQYYMLEQQVALLQSDRPKTTSQQILTMLQDVEHQIRTPLSLIQLYTDLLNNETPPAVGKTHIQQIQSTVAGLQSTLKKLTQGELRNGPKRHQVDLKLLLLDVLELLQPMLEKRDINLALDFQDCAIALDDWQIRQVLQNIIDNAIWFSPVGGTITCRCLRFQKEVLIQIADQGVGLSSQDQQNLFQANYSQRPGGTGMGMMIAKQIIMQHGGQIWAENLPTGGTQFAIALPC